MELRVKNCYTIGMVNDHTVDCFRHADVSRLVAA